MAYKNFVFHRTFYEAANKLSDNERLALYDAIINYALDGTLIDLEGVPEGMFGLIKPSIDAANKKRESGRVGGKANTKQSESETEANTKQSESKAEANTKQSESKAEANTKQSESKAEAIKDKGLRIKDKGQGIEEYKELSPKEDTSVSSNLSIREVNSSPFGDSLSGKPDDPPPSEEVKEVVGYLNYVLGTQYSPNTYQTKHAINARLRDYSLEEIKRVIDLKADEWGTNPKMAKYLRPSTLFRQSNFENYVNERRPFDANDYMLGIINGGDP